MLQYQDDPDQEVFQGFCLSNPELVQCAACSAKKKKKVESFDVPETLEEAVKKGATVLNWDEKPKPWKLLRA